MTVTDIQEDVVWVEDLLSDLRGWHKNRERINQRRQREGATKSLQSQTLPWAIEALEKYRDLLLSMLGGS